MANKSVNQWQELEASLLKELPHVISFFTETTGLEVAVPSFKLSGEFEDVEWYADNTIFINPSYMTKDEKISYEAMLAHSYFHHVQYTLFGFYRNDDIMKKLGVNLGSEKIADLINNFVESSAMFFAAAYITRQTGGSARTDKLVKYLKSGAYAPPKGRFYGGNEVMLLAYSGNGYDIKKTLKQILSLDGSVKIMENYLRSLE